MKREIFCAAIRLADGRAIGTRPGLRHSDIICELNTYGRDLSGSTQGFLTTDGVFVNRTEGYEIAKAAGQLLPQDRPGHTPTPGTLYTEDMW